MDSHKRSSWNSFIHLDNSSSQRYFTLCFSRETALFHHQTKVCSQHLFEIIPLPPKMREYNVYPIISNSCFVHHSSSHWNTEMRWTWWTSLSYFSPICANPWPKRHFYTDFRHYVLVLCILCKSFVLFFIKYIGANSYVFSMSAKIKCCNVVATLRAEQGSCEPNEDFISKIPEE